jgi:ABC-type bacteriocin/lantibiotic exporter with double-glycine peptidase domain
MPLSGAVTYDGADLRNLDLELLRRQVGVVGRSGATAADRARSPDGRA